MAPVLYRCHIFILVNIVIPLSATLARFPGKLVNIGSINKIPPSKTIPKPR